MFIDSHAHLDYPDFEGDLDEVVGRAQKHGVEKIITVGTTLENSKMAVRFSKRFKGTVFATVGLHPHDIEEVLGFEKQFEGLKKLAGKSDVAAIGECGLDYSRIFSSKLGNADEYEIKKQKNSFVKQLDLAKEKNLPVIVHSRMAEDDTFDILSSERYRNLQGVVHCHTGTVDFAEKVLKLGFYIGFTGIITFPNAAELSEVIEKVSLDRILIETDSPFIAPVPYRGQRNEPAYVVEVAKKITEIKGMSLDEVAKTTTANAEKLFGI